MNPLMRLVTAGVSMMLAIGVLGVGLGVRAAQVRRPPDQPTAQPIFTPGPAEVVGTVSVANEPTVNARQVGTWTVALANPPQELPALPLFLQVGRVYLVRWPTGAPERHRMMSLDPSGWIQTELLQDGAPSARRWLNPRAALTIEAVE